MRRFFWALERNRRKTAAVGEVRRKLPARAIKGLRNQRPADFFVEHNRGEIEQRFSASLQAEPLRATTPPDDEDLTSKIKRLRREHAQPMVRRNMIVNELIAEAKKSGEFVEYERMAEEHRDKALPAQMQDANRATLRSHLHHISEHLWKKMGVRIVMAFSFCDEKKLHVD